MEDHRISKQLLFGELEQGHRRQGRPCKSLQTSQGHIESRLALVWHPTNWTGCYCSGQTALVHTYTICIICTRGRASPPGTARQRTPPLSSLSPSNKCELPVPRLRMALQVQDRPAEPLPYPQIRGTDNVILETEGPPWWWWWWWWSRGTAQLLVSFRYFTDWNHLQVVVNPPVRIRIWFTSLSQV